MDVDMDVYGRRPKSEEGICFRNNRCAWHPLATYTCEVAPDVTSKCQHWHTNDGDGLNDEDSVKLADALQAEIDSGRCAQYAENAELGKWFWFNVENVRDWIKFLRECGGFVIS